MGVIVSALAAWLLRFLGTGVLVYLGYVLEDWIFGLIGQAFDLFSNSVSGTSFSLPSLSTLLGTFPPEALSIMKRIHFDTALSTIVSAVTVRGAAAAFSFIRTARRGVTP